MAALAGTVRETAREQQATLTRSAETVANQTAALARLQDGERVLLQSQALLQRVMRDGKRIAPSPALSKIRDRARQELAHLPQSYRRLANPDSYPVRFSSEVKGLLEEFRSRFAQSIEKK